MTTRAVLLPGMDGTGDLFARFVAACPEGFATQVVSLPRGEALGYDDLVDRVVGELPDGGRWFLLGESFSGPLAVRLAATCPPGLVAIVLCASFVRAPLAGRAAGLVARVASRVSPPTWILRRFLTGDDAALAAEVRHALASVAPAAIAARMRAIASVDVSDELQSLRVPVLVLSGSEDRLLGGGAAEIADVRPDVTVVSIRAPHLLLQMAPNVAWSSIVEFVR